MHSTPSIATLETQVRRLGIVLQPAAGDAAEADGILNPASARSRSGALLLYPRSVAEGNVSRVRMYEARDEREPASFESLGFALEPREPNEVRDVPGGYGCEDPRVTFMPALDAYVMAYTAFGPSGPRIALAVSGDGYAWERLGLVDFSGPGLPNGDDKDAAFFPEPVLSPAGVLSFAFYHRPMILVSASDARGAIPIILALPPSARECTRIAYVPVEPALRDRRELLRVAESVVVLEPGPDWGLLKNGGGTPPVRIAEGWLSFFHGVDPQLDPAGASTGMKYSAGIVIHDAERPDRILYRSPAPIFAPETPDEKRGMVHNVVFPTAIDPRPDAGPREFDVYYGMADSRIGLVRVSLGASECAEDEPGTSETAA